MSDSNISNFFINIKHIIEKDNEDNLEKKYNIFEVEEIDYDEVRICMFLKDILDPKGKHENGFIFLKLFVENVLNIKNVFSDDDYRKAIVQKEKLALGRRIDIYININGYSIPIEVKIYAGEQENQCFDYINYVNNIDGDDLARVKYKLYYLTLDKHCPTDYSAKGYVKK